MQLNIGGGVLKNKPIWLYELYLRHKAMATFVLWGTTTPASFSNAVCCRTQSVCYIAECATELLFLLIGETTLATVAINAIKFVIQP